MNDDTHHIDTWLITILRIKGIEHLNGGKSLRQHVRMVLESAEDTKWFREVETSLGVDGQNCNRMNRLEMPSAIERSWRIRVEVYIRPRKRKNSRRSKNIISGSCSYTVDELFKLERASSGTFQFDHVHIPALTQYFAPTGHLQLRIDPVIKSRRGNVVRRGTSSNGLSFLCAQLQRRRSCARMGHHGCEWLPEDRYEEYLYQLKEETCTTPQIPRIYSNTPGSTESLPNTSDNETTSITSKETTLRKRKKYRGYLVNSDDEFNDYTEDEDEDEDWLQPETASDWEEGQEHGLQNVSLIGIFALLHPILPIHTGSEPSIDEGFGEFLSHLEGSLCKLTVYGHLCRIAKFLIFSHPLASQDTSQPTYTFSRYLPVMFRPGSTKCTFKNEESKQQAELLYERVTKEWRVSGQVLLGLAA
ncbi:hypothetical protein VNI00_015831 [Paramarasmius palmivorus]|uniref:Uncharacterized protein n=1 Tax=Paramarasmius palmivorus TaxID=297713 RepID=A0AAW0BL12_9AGAR